MVVATPPSWTGDSELSDERIVERVRAGERDLFEILMRRHNQRIYRAVRAFVPDAEAEDVMQQAYLQAFVRLDQLHEGGKIAPWLVRIAVNEAIDRVRKRRRLAEDALEEDMEAHLHTRSRPSPENELGGRELAALLEAAVGDLGEIYRIVYLLREVEGMTTEEVAQALGVSELVVKVRLHRAKASLRRGLLARSDRVVGELFPFHAPRCDRVVQGVLESIASLSKH
jgi:RNA polymerase sigma-70 factor (ECF subfamily)